jgi:hypothetical protein
VRFDLFLIDLSSALTWYKFPLAGVVSGDYKMVFWYTLKQKYVYLYPVETGKMPRKSPHNSSTVITTAE